MIITPSDQTNLKHILGALKEHVLISNRLLLVSLNNYQLEIPQFNLNERTLTVKPSLLARFFDISLERKRLGFIYGALDENEVLEQLRLDMSVPRVMINNYSCRNPLIKDPELSPHISAESTKLKIGLEKSNALLTDEKIKTRNFLLSKLTLIASLVITVLGLFLKQHKLIFGGAIVALTMLGMLSQQLYKQSKTRMEERFTESLLEIPFPTFIAGNSRS